MDAANPGAQAAPPPHRSGAAGGVPSGRVAVVAGAGGELGRATARALAAAGYTVVGVDRSEKGLEDLPDGARRVVGDATDPASARTLIDSIAAEVGSPEVLVNTIGTFRLGAAVDATPEDLRVLMDVIAFLAGDLGAPVTGAIVPAYVA
jgi:NAD(P)-dependent dehydrogenase (short-subunit alcohol dehydrogenase family)